MILLFANGDLPDNRWLAPLWAQATAVIGVDGGTHHILHAGQTPTMMIGDFDSIEPALLAKLTAQGIPTRRYSAAKDETDLELALHVVIEEPAWQDEEIWIVGVVGGRLDQTLANILLLAHPDLTQRTVKLVTQHQAAWLITQQSTIQGKAGDIVSLIPLGGDVKIDYTTNLRWNLQNELLRFGPARGVSNELTATTAEIYLKSGQLLCIHSLNNWRD